MWSRGGGDQEGMQTLPAQIWPAGQVSSLTSGVWGSSGVQPTGPSVFGTHMPPEQTRSGGQLSSLISGVWGSSEVHLPGPPSGETGPSVRGPQ